MRPAEQGDDKCHQQERFATCYDPCLLCMTWHPSERQISRIIVDYRPGASLVLQGPRLSSDMAHAHMTVLELAQTWLRALLMTCKATVTPALLHTPPSAVQLNTMTG
jgi:hypothetical protein